MKRKILVGLLVLLLLPYITVKAVVSGDLEVTGIIEGVVGFELENNTLELDVSSTFGAIEFDDTNIEIGEDVSSWFINLPTGLIAEVVDVDVDYVIIQFSGVYEEIIDENISVSIPEDKLNGYGSSLENDPNENAKFIGKQDPDAIYHDAYTVSGIVGQEIEVQKIYIDIKDLVENSELLNIEIEYTNGLKGKITNITPTDTYTKIIEVTFTGTPTMEDHSEIEYTLYKNGMEYINDDIIIPTRVDVVFNIIEEHIDPPAPPYIPPYTPVLTGID